MYCVTSPCTPKLEVDISTSRRREWNLMLKSVELIMSTRTHEHFLTVERSFALNDPSDLEVQLNMEMTYWQDADRSSLSHTESGISSREALWQRRDVVLWSLSVNRYRSRSSLHRRRSRFLTESPALSKRNPVCFQITDNTFEKRQIFCLRTWGPSCNAKSLRRQIIRSTHSRPEILQRTWPTSVWTVSACSQICQFSSITYELLCRKATCAMWKLHLNLCQAYHTRVSFGQLETFSMTRSLHRLSSSVWRPVLTGFGSSDIPDLAS